MTRSDYGMRKANGVEGFNVDKRRIRLARVWGTGHVEFTPILTRIQEQAEAKIISEKCTSPVDTGE